MLSNSERRFEFVNRVGGEAFNLLARRALEELSEDSEEDRFNAVLAAALIPVAEVLRDPVEAGVPIEDFIELTSRWIRKLLNEDR